MMKGIVKGLAAAGLGLALVTNVAQAQKPGPEIGIWLAGFTMDNPDGDNNNTTNFDLNGTDVSVAFYMTEMIAIEPTLSYHMQSYEASGVDGTSQLGLRVGVPIYLAKGWGKAGGFYVEPAVGLSRMDPGAADAVTAKFWGVSVGTKRQISGDFFWRAEAFFENQLEDTDNAIPKETWLGARFGLTLYWPN